MKIYDVESSSLLTAGFSAQSHMRSNLEEEEGWGSRGTLCMDCKPPYLGGMSGPYSLQCLGACASKLIAPQPPLRAVQYSIHEV